MTRFGKLMLALLLLAGIAFALMIRPAGERAEESAPVVAAAPAGELLIPVAGVQPGQLEDTWGDSRGGGTRVHNAIDIMAPRGTPVLAAQAGRVEKLFESEAGGHTVYVRAGPGTIHYYAHLDTYAPGLREGIEVARGQQIATVGDTGSAKGAPHLHFEVKRMRAGEAWHEGENVNPYPLLAALPGAS